MVKVRILTGVTAASAAALAVPSLVGCGVDAEAADTGEALEENNTAAVAGTGNVALHGYSLFYASTSGGDEFIRVGEKMTTTVSFDDVLDKIAYRYDPAQASLRAALSADHDKVKLSLKVTYTKFDEQKETKELPMTWGPGAGGIAAGTSESFTIPEKTKAMALEVIAKYTDLAGAEKAVEVIRGQGIPNDFVVFGAFTPNKLALFDTNGAERRTRVVEGGGAVKGANLLLSVTDWRLDTVVDKTSLDLRVGQKNSGSRFGPVVVDALGALEYEVTAAVSVDGGRSYMPLRDFQKIDRPAVLSRKDGWRFAHEASVAIPADGGPSLKIAFNIKAFLRVPSYYPGEIMNARYAPGARILLKDVWDNNGGQDYSLPIVGP